MDNSKFFKEFFTCPSCGKALCEKSQFAGFDDDYCVHCGAKIANDRKLALKEIIQAQQREHLQECQKLATFFHVPLEYATKNYNALSKAFSELNQSCVLPKTDIKEQNNKETKQMPEMIQIWQSEVPTTDFEVILIVMQELSKEFIPGGKKRKLMLDYDKEKQAANFTLFKVEGEAEKKSQIEKMEMIKFCGWIKSFDDLEGTGLKQISAFMVKSKTVEKILENIPYLAEKIQLKNKMRVIADYDPQKKEVVFNHYEIKT